ncbi:MAG: fluoride efflux transporter CrcB [Stappiaceae bacterium]
MKHLLLVALGGAVGASCRHLVGLAALRLLGPGFPWGTLAVNVLGSFAMGVFIEMLLHRLGGSPDLRYIIATGFLGGFTTFSAFSLDFAVLWERGDVTQAGLYLLASVLFSVFALFAGLWVVRTLAV